MKPAAKAAVKKVPAQNSAPTAKSAKAAKGKLPPGLAAYEAKKKGK
jgi:hypothetical protein